MGKKIKIKSLFKNSKEARNPWQWPSCKHPKTQSFRGGDSMFKTVNSVFFDQVLVDGVETPDSWFTNSSETASLSTESEDCNFDGESLEMVVRGVMRSERLFFEPGDTNSILEEAKTDGFPFKESVALAMESEDPYVDFRRSMEEMVESHGVKDWEGLEELLGWYLRVNGKKNHGFIIGAFVDLLVRIASASASAGSSSCPDTTTSFCSAISSFSSSSPSCSFQGKSEICQEEKMVLS
ncbi:Ovate family protein 13 [Tripterygium wilfordii]|uniref:Transcription repressor n=1 Tax=Tripterygium wilfordii TaxID=458696 RepID=A0A7J7D861_TRIWF|nr:transcription repressor OFP13 [Tripterygium wilfordii]KAF5742501.1 Ovate family protein 13 [Tripterygium wilfordii]